jgi:hypothetical protein
MVDQAFAFRVMRMRSPFARIDNLLPVAIRDDHL